MGEGPEKVWKASQSKMMCPDGSLGSLEILAVVGIRAMHEIQLQLKTSPFTDCQYLSWHVKACQWASLLIAQSLIPLPGSISGSLVKMPKAAVISTQPYRQDLSKNSCALPSGEEFSDGVFSILTLWMKGRSSSCARSVFREWDLKLLIFVPNT